MTTSQIITKYGKPNETGRGYLTQIQVPYPMRLAWDTKVKVNKISCHKLIAPNLTNVFNEILAHYGKDAISDFGIDLYGGCFNYRKMRNGVSWSKHAWGIAIDLDPDHNRLEQNAISARFSREEYRPMIDIFYRNGFLNLGIERDYDYMHFEIRD
jgi:hypothetical protein